MGKEVNGVSRSRFEAKARFTLAVDSSESQEDTLSQSHLDTVFTAWNVLALDGSNWQSIDLFDFQRDIEVTKDGIQALVRCCPGLKGLFLKGCTQLEDEALKHIDDGIRHLGSGSCAHDRLEVIELDNCPLITDASLEHLKTCHCLDRIELYDCQQITRAGIKRLRTHLPNIKVHAYFAPVTPPPSVGPGRQRFCRCCILL
ncbi:F-box/LRR-repeat protein 20 [Bagarius yarrelli]|uniref:F-box/LRR-repeat protein 20 n=1 Tax=Bagarius yarrelli TaxID=175774 RepID=A0A556VB17_BAGYA|nr:F-box/LRR-repeat protein 20 [Bagarius yarrelli]